MFRMITACVVVALVFTLSAGAQAATVEIHNGPGGENDLGTFNGTIAYDGISLLSITLENTSPIDNGGYITGFLFNINGDATASLDPDPQHNFQGVSNENGAPFGTFEAGAAIGGNWQGGGNPTFGIGVGDSATFDFAVTGSDAGSLVANDFITKTSSQGDHSAAFLVRFRGFDDDGSDKVPGVIVPSPAAAGAGMLLLGGLLMRRTTARRGNA